MNPRRLLRQPYTGINIGDIGYIHDGQFELLFPASSISGEQHSGVSVPTKFTEAIAAGVKSGELQAGCFHTESVKRIGPRDNGFQGFTPLYVPSTTWSSAVFKVSHLGLKAKEARLRLN